jgi:hypothetical protein
MKIITEKMKLKTIPIPWKLGRYGIEIIHSCESESLNIKTVGVDFREKEQRLTIRFNLVAALKFFNFNFEEHNYGEYETITALGKLFDNSGQSNELYLNFWRETGNCYDSYFYTIENTKWFEEKDVFADLTKREFKHYLIEGYDSYLEVLADKYEIIEGEKITKI